MKHFYCIFMFPLKHHTPVSSCISIVIISIDIMPFICSVVSQGHAAKHGYTVCMKHALLQLLLRAFCTVLWFVNILLKIKLILFCNINFKLQFISVDFKSKI